MPINNGKKLIFVHIPKTAGTSIEQYMDIHTPGDKANMMTLSGEWMNGLVKHFRAQDIRAILSPEIYDTFETFTVVRNPWDRIASLYHYGKQVITPAMKSLGLKDFLVFYTFELFLHLIQTTPNFPGVKPQTEYILDEDGKTILVKKIFKYENLNSPNQNVKSFLARKMGKDIAKFPHANKLLHNKNLNTDISKYQNFKYQNLYSPETAKIVQNMFSEEIRLFDYEFEGKPLQKNTKLNMTTVQWQASIFFCKFSTNCLNAIETTSIAFITKKELISRIVFWILVGMLFALLIILLCINVTHS